MTINIDTFLSVGHLLVPVDQVRRRASDEDYVGGAIELTIDGRAIMTRTEVDLVDLLWAFLVNISIEADRGVIGSTGFPDQPIELTVAPQGRRVEVTLRYPGVERRASADADEFFTAVINRGIEFFEMMKRVTPTKTHILDREIGRLGELRRRREGRSARR